MAHPLLQFFAYEHLPDHLQAVSKPFGDLARQLDVTLPGNSESTTALRKLLEAKDCAVRAVLYKAPEPTQIVSTLKIEVGAELKREIADLRSIVEALPRETRGLRR